MNSPLRAEDQPRSASVPPPPRRRKNELSLTRIHSYSLVFTQLLLSLIYVCRRSLS
jgi:hypothetical protein